MAQPPTVEVLAQAQKDCERKQDERYGELMKRIERIEGKMIGALGIGVILILTAVVNIVLALVKK